MSQNWRKMAKMLHNAAKKFDWDVSVTSYQLCCPLLDWCLISIHRSERIIYILCTVTQFTRMYQMVKARVTNGELLIIIFLISFALINIKVVQIEKLRLKSQKHIYI